MANRPSIGFLDVPADDARVASNSSSVGAAFLGLAFLIADFGSDGLGGFRGGLPGKMRTEP